MRSAQWVVEEAMEETVVTSAVILRGVMDIVVQNNRR